MSNPIRYDPLLVRAVSAELRAALQGRSVQPQPVFDRDISCALAVEGGETLRFDLHPRRGWITLGSTKVREYESPQDDPDLSARVVRVSAPADERLLRIDLHEGGRFRGGKRSLVVELHTNQWNVLLIDSEDRRIVSALRARDAGGRSLKPGAFYQPPAPARRILPDRPRDVLWTAWLDALAHYPPAERPRELVRRFAYASPLNAAALLGPAALMEGDAPLEDAFERWWEVADGDDAGAFILRNKAGPQPYPIALEGVESVDVDLVAGGLEREHAHHRVGVVALVEIDVAGLQARLRVGTLGRLLDCERRQQSLHRDEAVSGFLGDLLDCHSVNTTARKKCFRGL